MKDNLTEADWDLALENLKKKDLNFDLMVEYGHLLMIHINDFTEEKRKRYYELEELLKIRK